MNERENDAEFRELREAARRLPRSIEPARDLWPGIAARIAARRWRRLLPLLAAAALVALLVARWAGVLGPRGAAAAWQVARLEGAPRVGTAPLTGRGVLRVGDWIVTDDTSRALIRVGEIGRVEVEPGTRIRLVTARPTDHRLDLARGAIAAKVDAPPRLFFVETPAGVAVDLGCAYTLAVDSAGGGLLHVTGGIVEFQWRDRRSIVPFAASLATRRGFGPGTPYVEEASDALRRALAAYDFEGGGAAAVRQVLALARSDDGLSLWHLLLRVDPALRGEVYDRLATLVPPPAGVTRDGALRLDQPMLDRYWNWIPHTVWRR